MPSGFWNGLVGGFMGHREARIKREQERDAGRRQMEGQVFEHLLRSEDPEMVSLALAGLIESGAPGPRKKGLAGYFGELEGGAVYPAIRQRMNETVPDTRPEPTPTGGPTPPRPGSAAMSTNVPVQPGSRPLGMPTPPIDFSQGGAAGIEAFEQQQASGEGPPPQAPIVSPPAPPPVSRFTRRGTGVPTAQEIAEYQARMPIRARIAEATTALRGIGADEDTIQQAILGIAGAPQRAASFGAVSGFAMVGPDGSLLPLSRNNQTGEMVLPDGSEVPPGAQIVKTSGTSGSTALKRNIVPDRGSPTGYMAVYTDSTGKEAYRTPTVYAPPPAYSGTVQTIDDQGVPVIAPVNRGGGTGAPLGDVNTRVESTLTQAAKGIKAAVDRMYADDQARARLTFETLPANHRDKLTAQIAQSEGQPFYDYQSVVMAANMAGVPPRQNLPQPGSIAERVRAIADEQRRRAGRAAGGPPTPPPLVTPGQIPERNLRGLPPPPPPR